MFHQATIESLLLSFLILINFSCTTIEQPVIQSRAHSHIQLTPCRFPNHKRELLCGKYSVYENRAASSGRMIRLNIVIVPALATLPALDPVFFLAGGPGQGAARIASAHEDPVMRELRRERDLVFIDQRGTGDSHPLRCTVTVDRNSLQTSFRDIFDPDFIRTCRQQLEKDAELKFYTTSIAMDDIDEVRDALGYEKINLYGISYGSLSALEYLRRYPHRVRAVLLAGVATPAAKLPLQFAQGAQRAMDQLLDDCAGDPSCQAVFPALKNDFAAVLRAFADGPVSFEMTHPTLKTTQTVSLSRGVFVERLRLMLYDHLASSLIPFLIHRAAQGDWSPFGTVVARPVVAPAYSVALGTYLTVTCSESVAVIGAAEIIRATSGTFLGDYRTLRHQQACAEWPRRDIPGDFFAPIKSAVPVLMLSGDIDPATPAQLANGAARHLANSRQILLRNTPHNYSSACAHKLAVEFIGHGSVQKLDATCAASARRPRFLTQLPERYN